MVAVRGMLAQGPMPGLVIRPDGRCGDVSGSLDAADGIDTGREALVSWLRDQGATKSAGAAT